MDNIKVKLSEFPEIRVSLENISVNNAGTINSHSRLKDRELPDQHPISAITGLEDALKSAVGEEKIKEIVNSALANASENGDFDGKDGKTPVKGVDYFTEADKTEFIEETARKASELSEAVLYTSQTLTPSQQAQVRANIGIVEEEQYEFVETVDDIPADADTSQKYVVDGYIYTYREKSAFIEHNANDGTGYLNQRPSGTWGDIPSAMTGGWCSPVIPIDPTKMAPVLNPSESCVTVSGIEKVVPFHNGYSVVVYYYKQDGTQMYMKTGGDIISINTKGEKACPFTFNLKDTNIFADSNWSQVYGVRISLGISSSSITADDVKNLSVNVPFFNRNETVLGWYSTGQQYSNDKATQQNSADIASLREEVEALKSAVNTSPSNSGAKWYAIGDSITYGLYSTSASAYSQPVIGKRWVDYVAKYNGYELTNLGVSGSGFVSGTTFRTIVDRNDFSSVDLVTIMLGVNDWKNEAAVNKVGTMDDNISTGGTIVSELRYGIEKIIGDNPYCKIILITPINAKIGSRGTEATNWAYGYTGSITPCGSLKNFNDKLKEVCEYYGIQVVDMTNSSVVNRKSITTVLPDGIHPNLECYKALGLELARKITLA